MRGRCHSRENPNQSFPAMKAIHKHLDLGLLIARIGMGAGFVHYH